MSTSTVASSNAQRVTPASAVLINGWIDFAKHLHSKVVIAPVPYRSQADTLIPYNVTNQFCRVYEPLLPISFFDCMSENAQYVAMIYLIVSGRVRIRVEDDDLYRKISTFLGSSLIDQLPSAIDAYHSPDVFLTKDFSDRDYVVTLSDGLLYLRRHRYAYYFLHQSHIFVSFSDNVFSTRRNDSYDMRKFVRCVNIATTDGRICAPSPYLEHAALDKNFVTVAYHTGYAGTPATYWGQDELYANGYPSSSSPKLDVVKLRNFLSTYKGVGEPRCSGAFNVAHSAHTETVDLDQEQVKIHTVALKTWFIENVSLTCYKCTVLYFETKRTEVSCQRCANMIRCGQSDHVYSTHRMCIPCAQKKTYGMTARDLDEWMHFPTLRSLQVLRPSDEPREDDSFENNSGSLLEGVVPEIEVE